MPPGAPARPKRNTPAWVKWGAVAAALLLVGALGWSLLDRDALPGIGGEDDGAQGTVTFDDGLEPPAWSGSFAEYARFLYEGPDARQTGVASGAIDPARVAIVRGHVALRGGGPIEGASIVVADHPEYGAATSPPSGHFSMVVNGGEPLVLRVLLEGHTSASRAVEPPILDYAWVEDVALVALDAKATKVELSDESELQVARGSTVKDESGERAATVMFLPGTRAEMVLPDGSTEPLDALTVRATEYTVGDDGPAAMPGLLPETSAYTYAVELSVDEAIAAGATSVSFTQPVYNYVENFLGFPVGTIVPNGYFDAKRAEWIAADNGVVIGIVDVEDGLAIVDAGGSALADDMSEEELAKLAELYEPGTTLWRVPIEHFTPWDHNWPYAPPDDAEYPTPPRRPCDWLNPLDCIPIFRGPRTGGPDEIEIPPLVIPPIEIPPIVIGPGETPVAPPVVEQKPFVRPDFPPPKPKCPEEGGSVILCESQTLLESIPVAGTPFTLRYSSERASRPGGLLIPLTGPTPPASLEAVHLELTFAGKRHEVRMPAAPDLSYRLEWDGRDDYGTPVTGAWRVTGRIGYEYKAVYTEAVSDFERAFARLGGRPIEESPTREEVVLWSDFTSSVDAPDAKARGFGGWSLNVQHSFDRFSSAVRTGSGESYEIPRRQEGIELVAGQSVAPLPQGSARTAGDIEAARGLAVARDGTIYVADTDHLWAISPSGSRAIIAGGGRMGADWAEGGDPLRARVSPLDVVARDDGTIAFIAEGRLATLRAGALATLAELPPDQSGVTPQLAEGPDGKLYVANGRSIFVLDADGSLVKVVDLSNVFPQDFEVAPDGSFVLLEFIGRRVLRLTSAGEMIAIRDTSDLEGTDPSHFLWPQDLVLTPDGGIIVADLGNYRVWDVAADGSVTPRVGDGQPGTAGDGGLATAARLAKPRALALGPEGSLYVVDESDRVRRVGPDGIISTVPGSWPREVRAPSSIAVSPDGTIIIANNAQDTVDRVVDGNLDRLLGGNSPAGRYFTDDPYSLSPRARKVGSDPQGRVLSLGGDLFGDIIRRTDGPVERIGSAYDVSGFDIKESTDGVFEGAASFAVAPDGRIFAAESAKGTVSVALPDGSVVPFAEGLGEPVAIAWGGDALYVVDATRNGVFRVALDGTSRPIASVSEEGAQIVDIATEGAGPLYLADAGLHRVLDMDRDGGYSVALGTGAAGFSPVSTPTGELQLDSPRGVAVSEGVLYVADTGNDRILGVRARGGEGGEGLVLPSRDGSEAYRFDTAGRHIETIDALSGLRLLSFSYDEQQRLVGITERHGLSTTIAWTDSGATITSPAGARTALAFGEDGWLTSAEVASYGVYTMTYGSPGLLSTFSAPGGAASRFEFDGDGRLTRDVAPDGASWTFERTSLANASIVKKTSATGLVTTYRSERFADGTLRHVVVDPSGARAETVTLPEGRFVREADGTTRTMIYAIDPRWGAAVSYLAHESIRLPSGRGTDITYVRAATLADPSDPLSLTAYLEAEVHGGNVSTTIYDRASRTSFHVEPSGATAIRRYDGTGDLVLEDAPGSPPIAFTRDEQGRVLRAEQAANAVEITHAPGRMTMRDATGRTVEAELDADGRIVSAQLDGATIAVERDDAGRASGFATAGETESFPVTSAGLPEAYAPPQGASVDIAFDAERRVTSATTDGSALRFEYEGALLTAIRGEGVQRTLERDATGAVLRAIDGGVTLTRDEDGRLLDAESWSGPFSARVGLGHDAELRLARILVGSLYAYDLAYAKDGYIAKAGPVRVERDDDARIAGSVVGNVRTSVEYGDDGLPAVQLVETSGEETLRLAFSRDAAGRITGIDERAADGSLTTTFTYARGALASATRDGATTSWTYDERGDRAPAPGAPSVALDAQGRRTTSTDADGTTTYDHDALGQMRGATLADGRDVAYELDATGRRVAKLVDGQLAQGFVYAGERVVGEVGPDGTLRSAFVYAARVNVPEAMVRDGRTYAIVSDSVGSVRLVIDAQSGEIAQRIDYDPWGVVIRDTSPGFQPFGFAGGVMDRDTGLVHFGARDYDPTTGTWLTRDPLLFEDGLNAYAYARNDPVNRVDMNGLWSFSVSGYAGIGGGISVAYQAGVGLSVGYELGIGTPTASFSTADTAPFLGNDATDSQLTLYAEGTAKVKVLGKDLGGTVGVEWKEDLDCPGTFKDGTSNYNACAGPWCANKAGDVYRKDKISVDAFKGKKPFGAKAGVKMQMNVFRGTLFD